ncbi:MAG: YgaP-like transmembrane domain [Verrucomicrobiota bacterium]
MNWTCNIDRKGRIFRAIFGLFLLGVGLYLLFWSDHDFWAMGSCSIGAFSVFEALKGWCAIRALGLNLPI